MNRIGLLLALTLAAGALLPAGAAAQEAAKDDPVVLFGPDTFFYVVMPAPKATWDRFQKTALWSFYQDPAMRAFVTPIRAAVEKKMAKGGREFWSKLEMERPAEGWPVPTGPVALGVRLVAEKVQYPEYDWENWDGEGQPPIKRMIERQVPQPKVAAVVDFGDQAETAKKIAAKLAQKESDSDRVRRLRETVHGVEMITIRTMPPQREEGGAMFGRQASPQDVCYAFRGSRLVIGQSQEGVKAMLGRLGGAGRGSLAEDTALRNTFRRLEGPGDVGLYFNIRGLLATLKPMIPEGEKKEAEKVFAALGLEKVHGVGAVLRVAPDERQDVNLKLLATAETPKPPLLQALTPAAIATTGHKQLTADLSHFLVANYDIGKLVGRIAEMVGEAGGPNIMAQMQAAMQMTAPQGNRAPVNMARDVLGQLTGPVLVLSRLRQPYTDENAHRVRVAIGVRDANVLDTALGRIHDTFLAQGDPKSRRELRGTSIYLLPGGPMVGMMLGMPMGAGQDGADADPFAMAVVGSSLVFGHASRVEQAVRDRGREDLQPIQTAPRYRHAARFLPAQVGAWWYDDGLSSAEFVWEHLKEAGKPGQEPQAGADGAMRPGLMAGTPFSGMLGELQREFDADFTALPPFDAVKKHFAPTIGYLKATDDGLMMETVVPKPPKGE